MVEILIKFLIFHGLKQTVPKEIWFAPLAIYFFISSVFVTPPPAIISTLLPHFSLIDDMRLLTYGMSDLPDNPPSLIGSVLQQWICLKPRPSIKKVN